MGTYLTANITGPLVDLEKIKLKKLPTWELNDVIGWDLDEIVTYTGYPAKKISTGDWWITLEGNSKWSNEQSYPWAENFTANYPTLTVTIREEWDNRDADEAGIEQRVYRDGELILTESRQNGEVAMNLQDLVRAGREAYTLYDREGGDEHTAGVLASALRALIAGVA